MFRSLKARAAVLAVAALVGSIGFASTAGASKNDTKDTCKGNGWKTATRTDGSAFKSQGDCVPYTAKGGQLGSPCLTGPAVPDARDGTLDTAGNIGFYQSRGRTCTGSFSFSSDTVVTASSPEQATAKCVATGVDFTP